MGVHTRTPCCPVPLCIFVFLFITMRFSFILLLFPVSLGLHLDLYYESLCPDSTRFISQQIPEMWAALSEEVTINFVPYGFAETHESEDGELWFKCQHGERECQGNKVQACSLHLFSQSPDTQVSLITCMMSASKPDEAGPECFEKYGLEYSLVEDCLESGLGDELHMENGLETEDQNPKVSNVPWTNMNGEHLIEYWDLEELGLLTFLCQKFSLAGCP